MLAVAEWFVAGMATAAERNHGSPRQAELFSFGVLNRKLAFNADRSVVNYSNFRWHAPDGSRTQELRLLQFETDDTVPTRIGPGDL